MNLNEQKSKKMKPKKALDKHSSSSKNLSKDPSFSNDQLNLVMNFSRVIHMKTEDIQSCIENLKKIESHEESLENFFINELEKAKSMTSVEDLKVLIEGMTKRVKDDSLTKRDCAVETKIIFMKFLDAVTNLGRANKHLECEIDELKKTMADLQSELFAYKQKAEEDKKQAYIKIDQLEDVVAKLNNQLKTTEEDQAKLLIRQVMNVVPTEIYWKIFSEKEKKQNKTFWLSEIDRILNKLPDATEFEKQEKSKKVDLFKKFISALGGDLYEMEEFMKKFKDDVGGNKAAHPHIASKNKILDAVNTLIKSEDIDDDDVAKISILANVWENLSKEDLTFLC